MLKESIWVSPTILDGQIMSHSSTDLEDWELPYSEVNHAFTILNHHSSIGFRKDAIVNLERAIKFRLKMLNEIYQFKHLPGIKPKSQLDTMLDVGLIKPLMLRKIVEIRNGVQHNYKSTIPTKEECIELAEFAWYFLRSTDNIAKKKVRDVEISCGNDDYGCHSFYFYPGQKWLITASLEVPQELIQKKQIDGWLHIIPYSPKTHGACLPEHSHEFYQDIQLVKEKDNEFLVHGVVSHSTSANKAILAHYFTI